MDSDLIHTDPSQRDGEGLIFDIQRFSLHDGPGIRTLVFMKGCPLRCAWCSNPESQRAEPEIMFFEQNCIQCGKCVEECPFGEVLREHWPTARETRFGDVCLGCGKCVDACYAGARQLVGRRVTVEEVLETVLRDRVFYEESGGGVTVGGGEPAFQPRFTSELLRRCRESGLHTAMETCGHAGWRSFSAILEHVDLLLMDIKHMDSAVHREKTGAGNERILENARRAAGRGLEMVVRLPLIPGFNDGPDNLHALGRFVRDELSGVRRVDLLPYHSTGESKNVRLGREYGMQGTGIQSPEEIDAAREILASYGLDVHV